MALASRSSRKASGRRWLAVGVVLTLLVLLVDASIKSRSPGPTRQLNGTAWADRAFALLGQSTVQGRELSAFLTDTKPTSGAAVQADVRAVAAGSRSTYRSYEHLRAPADLAGAGALLQTCLLVRSEESRKLATAVSAALAAKVGTGAIAGAGSTVATALQRLEVADQACALFASQLPGWLHMTAPVSKWVRPGVATQAPQLTVFLTGLHSRVSLKPVYAVSIQAVSTVPSALGTRQGYQVLSPGKQLTVEVVVGNAGNQTERYLTVTASISAAVAGGASSAREFVTDLAPGTSQAVTIGYLDPPLGQEVTLTVTLTPSAGDPAKARTNTLRFEMPSPTTAVPPSTSSTSSTTVAGAGSSGAAGASGTSGARSGTSGASGTPPTT